MNFNVIKTNVDGTILEIPSTGNPVMALIAAYQNINNCNATVDELEIEIINGEYGHILFDMWVGY